MFFNVSILDVFFNLSIFALLVYQVYNLAQKHLIPFLFKQLQYERDQHTRIVEKQRLLVSTRHRLQNQIYNQKNLFTLLERNVQIWYKMMMEERSKQETASNQLTESIREKRAKQKKNIDLEKNLHNVLPLAIDKTRSILEKKYTKPSGKKILIKILQDLG